MPTYPSLPPSPRKRALSIGGDEGLGAPMGVVSPLIGPTNGGCSGNSFAGLPLAGNEANREEVPIDGGLRREEGKEDDEGARALIEEEEEVRVQEAIDQFEQGEPNIIAFSFWQDAMDECPLECRVMKMGGIDKRKTLIVYFPHGDGKTATMVEWKRARVRAAVARRRQKIDTIGFPWPWKNAIYLALSREFTRTGRPMTLVKWGRMFRLLHPESRESLWAEFVCRRCQQTRRVEARQNP